MIRIIGQEMKFWSVSETGKLIMFFYKLSFLIYKLLWSKPRVGIDHSFSMSGRVGPLWNGRNHGRVGSGRVGLLVGSVVGFLTNENDEKASKSKEGGYETFDFINVLNSKWFGASDIKIWKTSRITEVNLCQKTCLRMSENRPQTRQKPDHRPTNDKSQCRVGSVRPKPDPTHDNVDLVDGRRRP